MPRLSSTSASRSMTSSLSRLWFTGGYPIHFLEEFLAEMLPRPETPYLLLTRLRVTHPQAGHRQLPAHLVHIEEELKLAGRRHPPVKLALHPPGFGRGGALAELETRFRDEWDRPL